MDDAVARYRAASEANDIDGVMAALAADVELVSPISGRLVFRGQADLRVLLTAVYGSMTRLARGGRRRHRTGDRRRRRGGAAHARRCDGLRACKGRSHTTHQTASLPVARGDSPRPQARAEARPPSWSPAARARTGVTLGGLSALRARRGVRFAHRFGLRGPALAREHRQDDHRPDREELRLPVPQRPVPEVRCPDVLQERQRRLLVVELLCVEGDAPGDRLRRLGRRAPRLIVHRRRGPTAPRCARAARRRGPEAR